MNDVTKILDAIADGDRHAADELLPLVYGELRKLAAAKMVQESPGQTLQATALVHEAYLRLVDKDEAQHWNSRGHFFAAAAEAMRRILVERARHKASAKAGAQYRRVALEQFEPASDGRPNELLALNEAIVELERHDAQAAHLVKLRFFAGLTHQEAAAALGISRRAADRLWALAKAWLYLRVAEE